MSITLTLTANGEIALTREVLEHLGAQPGDTLHVDLLPGARMHLRAKPGTPASNVFGMLARPDTPAKSVEELNEAAAAGWAGELDRFGAREESHRRQRRSRLTGTTRSAGPQAGISERRPPGRHRPVGRNQHR